MDVARAQPAPADRRRRRAPMFWPALAAVCLYTVVDLLWLQFGWGGEDATLWFSDLSAVFCALVATAACVHTWRVESAARRRPWALLAAASASWAAGEIVWSIYELLLGREAPFPSLADVAYLAAYPLAAMAMLSLPTSPRGLRSRLRTALDALVVGASMMFVAWATFLGPLYRAGEGTPLEQAIGLAYPIADVVVAAVVLFVVTRAQRGRRTSLFLIALGLLSLAVADTAFSYLTTVGEYETGGLIDAAWDVGYLLIALAAIRHDPGVPRPSRSDDRRAGIVVPYVAVVIAALFAALRKVQVGSIGTLLFWGLLAIVLLVVVRQFLTLLDNMALARTLEEKVRERTAQLARSEARHRSLIQNSSDVVTIVDSQQNITYASPSTRRVFGHDPDALVAKPFLDLVHPEDRDAASGYFARFMARPGEAPVMEWRMAHADGDWRYCESIGANLLDDPSVAGFVLNTRDITDRKGLELQLRYQAFHDQLTGSANRALFRDRADQALKSAARARRPIAVLFCDLDSLKEVNDRYGHDVGDRLLTAVAIRLERCIRAEDTVARMGGDEFAILLTDSGGEAATKHVARRLLDALREPFEIDGHTIQASVSIGIALSWGRQKVDELLRNADLAMYQAKTSGKARFELFQGAR